MVQPPVSLPLGAEQHFAASFYAFKFAASQSNLMRQLHLQPLSVEVWASREEENDILVGIAKVLELTVCIFAHAHGTTCCLSRYRFTDTFILLCVAFTLLPLVHRKVHVWGPLICTW